MGSLLVPIALAVALGLGTAALGQEPAVSSPAAPAAVKKPEPAPSPARYAGRRLQDVLEELRASGLRLIYSSELVRRSLKVRDEPLSKEPRRILEEVLAPHGLEASPGPAGTLVVVKRPPAPADAGTAAPSDAAKEALRLGFNDAADVPGSLRPSEPAPAATTRLAGRDVMETPGAIDNIFRALQVVPGITGAGLYESKIAVRGGAPDQNLTVMDGVEIHNPFRLFGAVAGFNPDTVARFELMAGAFPAEYGDRLSSLLVVETRDGRRDEQFAGSASASATDASAVVEGALPGPGDGAWLLASRRTYYDLVAESFVGEGLPSFDDLQLKLSWRGASGRRFALTGWRSREGSDGDFSDAADRIVIGSRGANDLVAASFLLPMGGRAALRGVVSVYRFDESLDLDLQGRSDTRVTFDTRPGAGGAKADQVLTLGLAREVGVDDLAIRPALDLALSPTQRLQLGGEVHWLRTRWRQELPADRNPEAANGSSILFGAGLPDLVDSSFDGTRAAAFVQHQARLGALLLTTGLRFERPDTGGRFVVSPRLGADLDLGSLSLKAGAGLHAQAPGYEKLLHSDYFLDLSEAERGRLGEERALNLVLGAARRFGDDLDVALEGYYRDFSNLVMGRLESEAERSDRLALYDFPPALAWGLPREPLITSHPASDGEGRAYGLIASVTRADRPGRRLRGFVGYAWGVSERTAYGRTFPSDYDRPHALTAVAFGRLSSKLELGLTARVASGLPTTPPRGVLVLGAPDARDRDGDGNRDELAPARDSNGRLIYVADPGGASTLNTHRLPTYFRVDARLTYAPRGASGRWLFYLEALNLTNHQNASSYDWDIRLDRGAARPRIETGDGQDGIPFLPTIGVRVRF